MRFIGKIQSLLWLGRFFASFHSQLLAEWAMQNLNLPNLMAKRENFVLYLKETGFGYNTKILSKNLYQILLKLIRENPIKFNWVNFNAKNSQIHL